MPERESRFIPEEAKEPEKETSETDKLTEEVVQEDEEKKRERQEDSKEQISKEIKQKRWEDKRREIDLRADVQGLEIDKGIKESVVAFNMTGFPTSASCEGHIDGGNAAPWIEVSASDEPEERFAGENEIFQKVAEKYGIPFEDVKNMRNADAYWEAQKIACKNKETPEYKKWEAENKDLQKKATQLLQEFYQEREVSPGCRLQIEEFAGGLFRVHNGGEDYDLDLTKLSDQDREELGKRLKQYQKEMEEFTAFLKEKYFRED